MRLLLDSTNNFPNKIKVAPTKMYRFPFLIFKPEEHR